MMNRSKIRDQNNSEIEDPTAMRAVCAAAALPHEMMKSEERATKADVELTRKEEEMMETISKQGGIRKATNEVTDKVICQAGYYEKY